MTHQFHNQFVAWLSWNDRGYEVEFTNGHGFNVLSAQAKHFNANPEATFVEAVTFARDNAATVMTWNKGRGWYTLVG